MKMFKLLSVFSLLLFTSVQFISAEVKNTKDDLKNEVKNIILSNSYTIDVNRAIPRQGSMRNLTSPYSLTVHTDSIRSYLPYFGRAYSAPYGGGEGLNFTDTTSDYSVSFDKKGTAKINFSVRTHEDKYFYHIDIFSNGTATINVTPTNKQSITFQGELNLQENEKK